MGNTSFSLFLAEYGHTPSSPYSLWQLFPLTELVVMGELQRNVALGVQRKYQYSSGWTRSEVENGGIPNAANPDRLPGPLLSMIIVRIFLSDQKPSRG